MTLSRRKLTVGLAVLLLGAVFTLLFYLTTWEILGATGLDSLAGAYIALGKYDKAEPLLIRSLKIRVKALGPGGAMGGGMWEGPMMDASVARSYENLGLLYDAQGKYAEANGFYSDAWHIRQGFEEQAEAEQVLKRSLAIREKALGRDHRYVKDSLFQLAGLYYHDQRYAEAEPLYKRALAIEENASGPEHISVGWILYGLAGLYSVQGKYAEAEPLYQRALAILEKLPERDLWNVSNVFHDYASMLRKVNRKAEAEQMDARAQAIRDKIFPDYPSLLRKEDRKAEADQMDARARAIRAKQAQKNPKK